MAGGGGGGSKGGGGRGEGAEFWERGVGKGGKSISCQFLPMPDTFFAPT